MRFSAPGLQLMVGGLLFTSVFGVSLTLSVYHYKSELDTAYSDFKQKQELVLDKIADLTTVPLATYDLDAINRILARASRDNSLGAVAFGIVDAGQIAAGHPSKELPAKIMKAAEKDRSWGKYHDYPEGNLLAFIQPIELKRFDAKGVEQSLPLGKIIGIFSPKEVQSGLRRVLLKDLLIMLVCSLIGIGFAYWLLRRLLVKPTQDLVVATQFLAKGNFIFAETPRIASQEILMLWEAFRTTSVQLGRANLELEQRVRERTLDLEKVNRELKETQAKAVESERMAAIGKLADGVGHELRNPLGAIRNSIYYVRDSLKGTPAAESDPTIEEFLNLADAEIKNATQIILDLVDFAKAVKLSHAPTDIAALFQQIKSAIGILPSIRLIEKIHPGLTQVLIDPKKIFQVFVHLATNAIQSMPKGGELTFSARVETDKAGSWVVMEFKDTGSGIEPQNLKKVFEPLFTTKAKGTGLGLSIVKGIVEAHGGTIAVASEVGKGTVVTVRLPYKDSAAIPKTAA